MNHWILHAACLAQGAEGDPRPLPPGPLGPGRDYYYYYYDYYHYHYDNYYHE